VNATMEEKFFEGISARRGQKMMWEMMPKMMKFMMHEEEEEEEKKEGKDETPMAEMEQKEKEPKSKDGEAFYPMEICRQMISSIKRSNELAAFATPEIQGLFEEWLRQVGDEILALLEKNGLLTPEEIAQELKISKESAIYFLSRLAQKGIISLQCTKEKK